MEYLPCEEWTYGTETLLSACLDGMGSLSKYECELVKNVKYLIYCKNGSLCYLTCIGENDRDLAEALDCRKENFLCLILYFLLRNVRASNIKDFFVG